MDRQERLERTASMAYNKGLINNPGENNCFLNSAVQVLWHLDVFRRSFREIKGHYCMGQSCIFCALDFIFKQFQYSSNDALPPDGLRVALAVAFKNQHKFQLGDMDDAAECFENILAHMHFLVAKNEHDDACTAKHCISHQKFAMQVIEQTICACGEQSEPLPFFQLVYYVSASALCNKARSLRRWDDSLPIEDQFGILLRRAGQDTRECPSLDCKSKVQVQRLLLNCPDIVSIGLIWDSESPDADHIADVLECIGTTLKLSDLYHHVYDERARDASLQLVGIVTYYGKHYSTFFFHSKLRSWIYFDDARVNEIGSQWGIMMEKCRRCHYQPLLLLYANPNGTPVNVDTAPKKKILINGTSPRKTSEASQSGKRLVPPTEVSEVCSDGEKSPRSQKRFKLRRGSGFKQENKSYNSRKSLSSGDLTSPQKGVSRSPSNASDTAAHNTGKEKHKPSFRRIGNAIMQAVNPALAVSQWKGSRKNKSSKIRRSSTGSSESSGDQDLIDLRSQNEDAKVEIMKLYEQSKAMNAAQGSSVNHDSGISSVPSSAASSAAGSVSSTDTNHGGSEEDLMDFNQTWRHSNYDNWPVVYQRSRVDKLLEEAESFLDESQTAENHKDFASALSYCTEASTRFRRVTEERGVDVNTKKYADMKLSCCQARARNLRSLVQSQPPPYESLPNYQVDDRYRQQLVLRQQQQQHQQQQQRSPQYGTLSRTDRPVRQGAVPEVGSSWVCETPLSASRGTRSASGYNYTNYSDEQGLSTLPSKPKLKATVYSSSHYVNRGDLNQPSSRAISAVCTQQIKPESMCYSPVHCDRESEVAARMQNLSVHAPITTTVISVGDNRPKVIESRHSRPPPPPRRVSSATIYISPANQSSRTASSASYEPTVYSSSSSSSTPDSQRSASNVSNRSKPKVYYQGNLAASSSRSTPERSPSPARTSHGRDYMQSSPGTVSLMAKMYEHRSPKYVPAPPYNATHQREYLNSHSATSVNKPWYQTGDEEHSTSNAHDLRQASKRMIIDRPVCEGCRSVPIERRQRLCAGCENDLRMQHSYTASLY